MRLFALSIGLFLCGIITMSQAQFNSFPPGVFNNSAARYPAGGGGGGVTLSAVGTKTYTGSAGMTVGYTGITVGGSDTTLVGTITFDVGGGTTITPVSAVWDLAGTNQSMTVIENGGGLSGSISVIYCRQNPTSGNKTLTFTWIGSAPTFTNALTFTGSTTGCQNGNISSNSSTVAITSGASHIVVGFGASGGPLGTLTSAGNTCPTGSPTCVVYSDSSSGALINAFSEIAAGAGTVNIGSDTGVTHISGADIAP